MFVAIADGELR